MTPPSPRAFALFQDVLDLPEAERAAWLATASGDPTVRAEVASLLSYLGRTDGVLDRPLLTRTGAPAAEDPDAPDPVIGQQIGGWRVTGLLGRGGMGSVYRAERADETFAQHAALKLVHPRLGADFRPRFLRERALLAGLDHPGVARLLDGGLTPDGAPYLAMELVEGEPITAYANAHGLGLRERVALFLQACDAVAHAHLHLIVHRDLKPAHILVEDPGSGPRVKLLDFGIAKLLSDDEGGPELTRPGASGPLTPSYAAPEQLRGGVLTTATDVYALGLVLYELLAGVRPYTVQGLSPAEAERLICDAPLALPSAIAPPDTARALRGDLDTICLKALAQEPGRRYATADALAADLRRHLDGLPVEARPATARYRVGRFLRRHRIAATAAALVLLAILGGAGVALWQAREARAAAARAEAVNAFLVTLLAAASPEVDGRDVRMADLLDRAVATLDSAFTGTPDTESQLRLTLGITYRTLGLYDEAGAQLRRALALRTQLHGEGHPQVADVQLSLGRFYAEHGEYAAADSILTLALATEERHSGPSSLRAANVLNALGIAQYEVGKYEEAAATVRRALDYDEATTAPGDVDMNIERANLANALADLGRTDESVQLFQQVVAELRQYHPESEVLANALTNYGTVRDDQGHKEDAAALHEEAAGLFRTTLGPDHPKLGLALNNLGATQSVLGRHAEAAASLRESARIYGTQFGENYTEHPDQGFPLKNLAGTLLRLGQPQEAETAVRRALEVFDPAFGPEAAIPARVRLVLAAALLETDRPADAEALLRKVQPILDDALPDGHRDRHYFESLLGDALRCQGRAAEAMPLLQGAHAATLRTFGPDDLRTREAAARLASPTGCTRTGPA